MALQGVTCEIAFTATPFADPSTLTWTDVSTFLRGSVQFTRGRTYELAQMQAGNLSFSLSNAAGSFDPQNSSSPYSPYVVPGVPVRLKATYSGTTYGLFYGFIESWQQRWDWEARYPTVTVTAVDGLKAVLSYPLGLSYGSVLVQDYGGTAGSPFASFFPWQGPVPLIVTTVHTTATAGSTSIVVDANIPAGSEIALGTGASLEYRQVTASTDTGPYTLTVAATSFTHNAGDTCQTIWAVYYDSPTTSPVSTLVGALPTLGIAQAAIQLAGSTSYARPLGAAALTGLDSWFRIDTTGVGAFVYNGVGAKNYTPQPLYDYADSATPPGSADDTLSVWSLNVPVNTAPASVADPTSTTGWQTFTGTATFTSEAPSTATLLSRVWVDNGTVDYYGATKVMKATVTAVDGSHNCGVQTPKMTATAATAYTFSASVATDPSGSPARLDMYADWYNSSNTLISSSLLASTNSTQKLGLLAASATSPTGTTGVRLRLTGNLSSTGWHMWMGQILMWSGTYPSTFWQLPSGTSGNQLAVMVWSGQNVAPPGQTAGATWTWPCCGIATLPSATKWFHVAADSGRAGAPDSTASVMPSAWFNGATLRLWTINAPQQSAVGTATVQAVGAKLTSGNVLVSGSSIACSVDETYLPTDRTAADTVTATKAVAHYNYGLQRHDFPQQDTGARIGMVLDSLGWPSALRSIDTGTVTVLGQIGDTTNVSLTGLSVIQDANTAEGGLYFVARDGTFTFFNQTHTPASVSITIGDGTGEIPYQSSITTSLDDTYIYNAIKLSQQITDGTSGTAAAVQVVDSASQIQYKARALQLSASWAAPTAMSSLAAGILSNYSQPATRVAQVSVEGVTTGAFASLLPRDIGEKIQVNVRPIGAGPEVSVAAFIQGVSVAIDPVSWMFTFSLSPLIAVH